MKKYLKTGALMAAALLFVLVVFLSGRLHMRKIDGRRLPTSPNITLEVIAGNESGVTYRMKNMSRNAISYSRGNRFRLEKRVGFLWFEFSVGGKNWPMEIPTILMPETLKAGEEQEYTVRWDEYWGTLPRGTYRIVEEVRIDREGEGSAAQIDPIYAVGSFVIK